MITFLFLHLSCAYIGSADFERRLDPDGDGIYLSEDCDPELGSISEKNEWYRDEDQDGYGAIDTGSVFACEKPEGNWSTVAEDCDDGNPNIHPAQREVCDGIDNDCSGETDNVQGDDVGGSTFFVDSDGDGFGSDSLTIMACSAPNGYVENQDDCNDNDASVSPSSEEIPGDLNDSNCDGLELCFEDNDGDGFGGELTTPSVSLDCVGDEISPHSTDCNDNSINIFPGAAENDDEVACMKDSDQDGYGDAGSGVYEAGTDCDDNDSDIYPGAPEIGGDNIDQDCNNTDDCYQDLDNDGIGSNVVVSGTDLFCSAPGVSDQNGDCDDDPDSGVNTFPGAAENESNPQLCMKDTDNDGYGDANPINTAHPGSDCNDVAASIHPDATEITADGIDQDCDNNDQCYLDSDMDGYGQAAFTYSSLGCTDPGSSTVNTDCNDSDSSIYPKSTEVVADGIDQDCDTFDLCYLDSDEDGYGATTTILSQPGCSASNETILPGDCDDHDSYTYPGSAFNDSATDCMTDVDQDGYGDEQPDSIFIVSGTDCNDTDSSVYPFAYETPGDGIDQDCDDVDVCFEDNDEDGYGHNTHIVGTTLDCSGLYESASNDDCDDNEPNINPGELEIPTDGIDQNCDGYLNACSQLSNGDFEDGYTGWSTYTNSGSGTNDIIMDEEIGSHVLYTYAAASSDLGITQNLSCNGIPEKISFMMRSASTSNYGYGSLILTFQNTNGNKIHRIQFAEARGTNFYAPQGPINAGQSHFCIDCYQDFTQISESWFWVEFLLHDYIASEIGLGNFTDLRRITVSANAYDDAHLYLDELQIQ
ncbi:MAG: MopE-related protein [Myxococcota bacterium]|nr:MopE-related protein [Myxococcota bacterium]